MMNHKQALHSSLVDLDESVQVSVKSEKMRRRRNGIEGSSPSSIRAKSCSNLRAKPSNHHYRRASEPLQHLYYKEQREASHSRSSSESEIDDDTRTQHHHHHAMSHPPLILCMNPHVATIKKAAAVVGWGVHVVDTNQEALDAISSRAYEAMIVGFGTLAETPYCSPLVGYAKEQAPTMYRIVYAPETAQVTRELMHSCFTSGVDAIAWTLQTLMLALAGMQHFESVLPKGTAIAAHERDIYSSYPPLRKLQQRQDQLVCVAQGNTTIRVQALSRLSTKLKVQLDSIPRDFIEHSVGGTSQNNNLKAKRQYIRVVHVSDTDNHHRDLVIPSGDLFLYSGNFTNPNECKASALQVFQDFLDWLAQDVLPKFELVVFIAGNHDDLLDSVHHVSLKEHLQAKTVLRDFLKQQKSIRYLQNSAAFFHGLTIYGSPTVYCRSKSIHQTQSTTTTTTRDCTAFEEPMEAAATRSMSQRPFGIDVLLTNRAPSFLSRTKDYVLATDYLYESSKCKPPILHAFGHCNASFGIGHYGETLFVNASQELWHSLDKYSGGTPLVVNVPVPEANETEHEQMKLCGPARFFHRSSTHQHQHNQHEQHCYIEC